MSELKISEEFKNLIPPLSTEEFSQLEENIIKDGCREPLVIWNGYIVDGHNRYQICTENDIEFKAVEKDFSAKEEVVEWIILNQFGRRNLSMFQRSKLALRLKPIIQEKAKINKSENGGNKKSELQKSGTPIKKVNTQKELAKLAGVSHDTIDKTEKIMSKGTPEQIERVEKGGKGNSLNAVYKEIRNQSVETKVCNKCHEELPVTSFYQGKNACKNCINSVPRAPKDIKGNTYKIAPELKDLKEEDVIGFLYDTDRIIEHTIDDAIEDFQCNFSTYCRSLDGILERYKELIMNAENNKKIMTVLSEAVTAMSKLKGKYTFE